jgi:hypothetical protein
LNTLQLHNEKTKIKKLVPAKWDELFSLKQALTLVRLLALPDCLSLRFSIVKVLFNLKYYKFSDLKFLFFLRKMIKKDTWKIIALTEFLFKTENLPTKLFLTEVNNRICKKFDDTKFWQWASCDSYFILFLQEKEEKYLNKMIACFYLKVKQKFDASKIEQESQNFEKVAFEKKQLFLLWYMGNRERLTKKYTAIFDGTGSASNKNFGWAGILDDLSSDITKMEEVAEIELHTVLFSLNKKIVRNRETEQEYERNSKK